MALSLLAGAGLALHSFWNLAQVDLGLRTDHVLKFDLAQADGRFKDPAQIDTYPSCAENPAVQGGDVERGERSSPCAKIFS